MLFCGSKLCYHIGFTACGDILSLVVVAEVCTGFSYVRRHQWVDFRSGHRCSRTHHSLFGNLVSTTHGFIVHHWFLCRFAISGQFLFCSCYITSMLILDCVDLCTEVVMKLPKFCFAPWKKNAYLWRLVPFGNYLNLLHLLYTWPK